MNYFVYMYITVILAAILRILIKDSLLYMFACFILGVSLGVYAGLSNRSGK